MRTNGTTVGLLRRALKLEDMLRVVRDQAIVSTRLAKDRAVEIESLAERLRKADERRLELEERARESDERIAGLESDITNARATAVFMREQLALKTREIQERDAGRLQWGDDRIAALESALQRAETEGQKARADAAIYANALGRVEAALGLSGTRPPHEIAEHVERLKATLDDRIEAALARLRAAEVCRDE